MSDLSGLAAPPVFVVGLHRSGTTWVYDILTSPPEVAGVFESGMFAPDIGLGAVFRGRSWKAGEAEVQEAKRFYGTEVGLLQLLPRDALVEELRALTGRWLANALEPGSRYLVEKTPQHGHVMAAIAELFPGAAFVHVIRDGRDAAVSNWAAAEKWPGRGIRRRDVEEYASSWAGGITAFRRQAEQGDLRYMEVRYEDLRSVPLKACRELFDFCRIPVDDAQLEAIVGATDIGAVRRGDDDRFRRTGRVGGWQEQFGWWDGRRFHRAAGALLLGLGYERDRLWWLRRRGRRPGRSL